MQMIIDNGLHPFVELIYSFYDFLLFTLFSFYHLIIILET